MYAVYRETHYVSDMDIQDENFKKFQHAHAEQDGYVCTTMADVGEGKHLTLTFWKTKEDMEAARESIETVIHDLLNPMMTKPSKLLGTGPVVVNDLKKFSTESI